MMMMMMIMMTFCQLNSRTSDCLRATPVELKLSGLKPKAGIVAVENGAGLNSPLEQVNSRAEAMMNATQTKR